MAAMFGEKSVRDVATSGSISGLLEKGCEFEGKLTFEGTVRINGKFSGEIFSDGTLIVGEGPHHTGVEAQDVGLAVIYAGHYATETLGVRALGAEIERVFALPWVFVGAPTGL